MNRIRRIRRSLASLPRRAGALFASAAAAAPAVLWADPPLPPGWNKHPPLPAHTHTMATGGLHGWQIALIAAAAALFAAALTVITHWIRAARRRVTAGAAQATIASGTLRSRPMRRPS